MCLKLRERSREKHSTTSEDEGLGSHQSHAVRLGVWQGVLYALAAFFRLVALHMMVRSDASNLLRATRILLRTEDIGRAIFRSMVTVPLITTVVTVVVAFASLGAGLLLTDVRIHSSAPNIRPIALC